jgi:hypothetical protein
VLSKHVALPFLKRLLEPGTGLKKFADRRQLSASAVEEKSKRAIFKLRANMVFPFI